MWPLSRNSATLGEIKTEETRGGDEIYSRGGGEPVPQRTLFLSPIGCENSIQSLRTQETAPDRYPPTHD